ncbi:cytochrome P450 71A4-like protein [Tanacetum coccineum]
MSLLFHFPLSPSILILFFVILIWITFKRLSSTSEYHKSKPPSPRKLPIIGNLHQIGSNPHRSLRALTQKHGPLVLIQLGSVPVLVASSAEAACEILKTHDVVFASRPKLSITHALTYGSKDIAFSPYGEYWRQVRSIAVLQLLSSKRVQSFRHVREEETRDMIHKIGKSCGSVVDLGELLNLLTNNLICRVALGRTYQGAEFNDLLVRFTYLLGSFSVGNYIPWLSWVDRLSGLEGRTKKVAEEFDEFLERVLEEHIDKKNAVDDDFGGRNDAGQDLVDILLDVQRENTTNFILHRDVIKAAIMDLFAAGTDTTSTAIEWAISELIRHPRVMKKLQQEVREISQDKPVITEDDLEKMKYLQAVLKETMRLHTPLPLLISRESTQYVKLMGYDIAAGTQVIINAWAIGRDPSQWEEAETFRPERFLNSSIDYKGLNFEFIPFGAGRRGCPAIQFAVVINELVLANLVNNYDLALPDEVRGEEIDMSEITGLTLHRNSPLLVVATPRF